MQPMDLLFYKGTSHISQLIRWVTRSSYSHVALVLDNLHLVEADWRYPLRIRHISYRVKEYDLYRVDLTPEQTKMIWGFIRRTINCEYDFGEILKCLGLEAHGAPNKFTCSEWVSKAFSYAGIELTSKTQGVTPNDLAKSPILIRVK